MKRFLFVDFENVPKVDLGVLPADVTVPFFFGASQRTVPTAFLKEALKRGERFVPIDIEGQGKNALDFHIAFYLGEYLQATPDAECVILSRDKGFDPLVRHLVGRGFKARRVGAIGDAFALPVPAAAVRPRAPRSRGARAASAAPSPPKPGAGPEGAGSDLDRARAQLRRMPARNLPRRRTRLVAMFTSYFGRKLDTAAVERLVDALIAEGVVNEASGVLTYPKP